MALVNKEAEGSSIAIHVAAGKALELRCDDSMKFRSLDMIWALSMNMITW